MTDRTQPENLRRISFADDELKLADGLLYATAIAACIVFCFIVLGLE